MSFSTQWEDTYIKGSHQSIWPWSDVVSFVKRHMPHLGPGDHVLELGCGAGANIPFFQSLGVVYHAIDGSATAIDTLRRRYPEISGNLNIGDFTDSLPFDGHFALVLDRASITHNTTADIRKCLTLVKQRLSQQGRLIGIDWFSTDHADFARGEPDADGFTRTGYTSGSFSGVGRVHFSDVGHLRDLLDGFRIEVLEHKQIDRVVPEGSSLQAYWNFVASISR